jgi:hypothetical protein
MTGNTFLGHGRWVVSPSGSAGSRLLKASERQNELVNRRDDREVVLLIVGPSYFEQAIALRDPRYHAVLPIGMTEDDKTHLLRAMGARDYDFDLRQSRYGDVCVLASAQEQAGLIAFVANTVWSVVEAGWLHACEPPYERARARSVSIAEADAARAPGAAEGL